MRGEEAVQGFDALKGALWAGPRETLRKRVGWADAGVGQHLVERRAALLCFLPAVCDEEGSHIIAPP